MQYFLTLEFLLRSLKQNPSYLPAVVVGVLVLVVLLGVVGFVYRKYFTFLFKSLLRNTMRTALTSMAVMVLVLAAVGIWTILVFLDVAMTERAKEFKAIITERWQVPSRMPYAYATTLEEGAATNPGDVRPRDSMTWQFYGGTLDANKFSFEDLLFFFAMDPRKLRTMMDDLESLDPAVVERMVANKRGALLGPARLKRLNKRIGDRFTVSSLSHKGIDLEFEIVGELPAGRYDLSAVMNRDYLNDAMDAYPKTHNGSKHPLADKSLGLVWLMVDDSEQFNKVADQVMTSSLYTAPAVKMETASSGIAAFLEPYRDLLFLMKWVLVPALLVTMAIVIANAISISVRERRTEMAVLKVLGFGPYRILALVLGEAVVVGGGSGLLSAGLLYAIVHFLMGGFSFPIAFFPKFDIYADALWWGLLFGSLTALAGSLIPAWSARTVKVSEVFAKVA